MRLIYVALLLSATRGGVSPVLKVDINEVRRIDESIRAIEQRIPGFKPPARMCRLPTLTNDGKIRVTNLNTESRFTHYAFLAQTGDTELFIKTARHDIRGQVLKVAREAVILRAMNLPGGIPAGMEALEQDFISAYEDPTEEERRFAHLCWLGTMISETAGNMHLARFMEQDLSLRHLLLIGAKLIDIIAHIHARGVLHLDLHMGNILVTQDEDPVESLRVIDFGEAELFVDPATGHHVQSYPTEWTFEKNVMAVTPWMLRGESSPSRRDDFFRIPFLLLTLAGGVPLKFLNALKTLYDTQNVADKMCQLFHEAYPVLNELMEYACGLEYADEPDYAEWAARLRASARRFRPDVLIDQYRYAARHFPGSAVARPKIIEESDRMVVTPLEEGIKESHEPVGFSQENLDMLPSDFSSDIASHKPAQLLPAYIPQSALASPVFMADVDASRAHSMLHRLDQLIDAYNQAIQEQMEVCSIDNLRFFGSDGEMTKMGFTKTQRGSGTVLYSSDEFVVKRPVYREFIESILREKAVMMSVSPEMRERYFAPVLMTWDHDKVCSLRTLATVKLGEDLRTLSNLSRKEIAKIAVETIEIVEFLHSLGILHGDVHRGNVIIAKADGKARMIDLGRASVFVDPNGQHVKPQFTKPPRGVVQNLLAPFELEHFQPSRRDDMYRLAEMLYRLTGEKMEGKEEDWYQYKYRRFSKTGRTALIKRLLAVPGFDELVEFHHEMAQLDFYDRPDYEKWTEIFTRIMNE